MLFCPLLAERGAHAYGVVEGDRVTPFEGDLFGEPAPGRSGRRPVLAYELLAPVIPPKILAAAVNYQSHVPSARAVIDKDEAPATSRSSS